MLALFLPVLGLCFYSSLVLGGPLHIKIVESPSASKFDPTGYYEKALRLALEKTRAQEGEFIIEHAPFIPSVDRIKSMLINNVGVDVLWGSATDERKAGMRYIPVDLLQNLNNYRALLIRKESLSHFKKVTRLAQLKALRAGNGTHWTDTGILRKNQFNLATAVDFSLLIKMLRASRIDFITRGLHEVALDLEIFKDYDLAVSSAVMLHYEHPIHYGFFVRKEDEALAVRIERGLHLAQADGSLDELFLGEPAFAFGKSLLKADTLILELNN